MIVAPGFSASIFCCNHGEKESIRTARFVTYLSRPPPLPCVEVMVEPNGLIGIGMMTFGDKHEVPSMLRVAI